jgi:hypothetical protein
MILNLDVFRGYEKLELTEGMHLVFSLPADRQRFFRHAVAR